MYKASSIGALPSATNVSVGGIALPNGHLVTGSGDLPHDKTTTPPVLWVSEHPVEGVGFLWQKLAERFQKTGLWPLVLESLSDQDDRPWLNGELDPSSSATPDKYSAKDVLAEWWTNAIPEEGEDLNVIKPFGRAFPGLAAASPGILSDPDAPGNLSETLAGRLGLVAVSRPSDSLVALGWQGPANHFEDMGLLSSVLRSWEDRYGAYLVGIGFASLSQGVMRPPPDRDLSLQVAAEHFAACSDNIYQGAGSIEEYSRELIICPTWNFWWD